MLATLLTFPVNIASFVLAILLLYWLVVLLGLLDIDGIPDLGDSEGFIGITGIPIVISLSLWSIYSWLLLMPVTYYFIIPLNIFWLQIVLGLISLIIGFYLGGWLSFRTLKPWQKHLSALTGIHDGGISGLALRGKICIITTSRVDKNFGQASYDDKGAGLLLNVQAETPNFLKKGSRALIIDYNQTHNTYEIVADPTEIEGDL